MQSAKVVLDTSAIYYHLFGSEEMKEAYQLAIDGRRPHISTFVKMEWTRGIVITLIDVYSCIKQADSVANALIDINNSSIGFKPRKLKLILSLMTQFLSRDEDWNQGREKTLRKLGELIVRLCRAFETIFKHRTQNQPRCKLGNVAIPNETFTEKLLYDFYDRFKKLKQSKDPQCGLCDFKAKVKRRHNAQGTALFSEKNSDVYSTNTGYLQQKKKMIKDGVRESPKCSICERVADTIISVHSPERKILIGADNSFVAFSKILGFDYVKLPSYAELREMKLASQSETDDRE